MKTPFLRGSFEITLAEFSSTAQAHNLHVSGVIITKFSGLMEVSQNPLLTKSGCYWVTIVNLMEGQRQNSKCFAKCTIFVQLQQYSVSTGLCLSCVNPENLVKIHQQTWILWTFEGSASVSFSRSRKIHVSRLICTQFSGFTQDNQILLLTEFRGHWTKIVDLREETSCKFCMFSNDLQQPSGIYLTVSNKYETLINSYFDYLYS